jgi:predicted cobalt transporter CbtA
MRCLFTAHAEMALGIMVAVVAVGLWFLRQKETRTILSILGIVGGFFMLMLLTRAPGLGIGACVNPDMPCVVYMRPTIFMLAPLIIVDSAVGLVLSLKTTIGTG